MNRVFIIALGVLLIAGGFYLFLKTPSKGVEEEATSKVVENDSMSEREESPSEALNELKNSIQGVVDDSVQDEIQEAIENKMNNSETLPK